LASHRRTAAERTSVFVERTTLRGAMRESEASVVVAPRSRGVVIRCEQNAREVPPLVAVLVRQKGCAVLVRGGASPAETTARTFTRSGPVHARARLFGDAPLCGSSTRAVPARGRTKVKAGELVTLFAARGSEAARGRCPCIVVLQKSAGRPRTQRSVPPVAIGSKARSVSGARERESDHRRSLRRASAGAHRWQKGGGSSKLGDPHHVSAAPSMKVAWFRSCFGSGGMRVATTGGRHPGSVKRTPFTRPPRNRSWRPPSQCVAFEEKRARATERRRRQGCQRRSVFRSYAAEENALARRSSGRRSEDRAVKRDSPRPRLHRAAPSLPLPAAPVFGRVERRAETDVLS